MGSKIYQPVWFGLKPSDRAPAAWVTGNLLSRIPSTLLAMIPGNFLLSLLELATQILIMI